MKLITAVIKTHQLDAVRDALTKVGVQGMTVAEVKGFGRQGGHTETYRGAEYNVGFVPKWRLDVVVDDAVAGTVADALAEAARTGSIGDGKIWITTVDSLIRIRTGERGPDAI